MHCLQSEMLVAHYYWSISVSYMNHTFCCILVSCTVSGCNTYCGPLGPYERNTKSDYNFEKEINFFLIKVLKLSKCAKQYCKST